MRSRGTKRAVAGVGAAAVVVLVVVLVVTSLSGTTAHKPSAVNTTAGVTTTTNPYAAEEARNLLAAERVVNATLPARTGAPAPTLRRRPYRTMLASHQVVGFVPWYELGNVDSMDLGGFTTLVYSELGVHRNGTLDESMSSQPWSLLSSGAVNGVIATGHSDGDRVLLAVFAEAQSVLGPLCAHGAADGARLARQVARLLPVYDFDGVDLDLEGSSTADRAGFVTFVKAFASTLKARDRTWTVMLNTYAQSVENPTGFFDVQALAPYVNQLFVMAYDMENPEVASADAPLAGAELSDVEALATYTGAGLAGKTILGNPFYGYDFPAQGKIVGSQASGQPYAVTYDQIYDSIVENGHKPRWDSQTETPYIVFRRSRQWHQTWFDDPVSIALKVALASKFHVAGVGAWELGMVVDQPRMITLLAGGSPVVKLALAAQP
jgi:Glycosyl hydrolases family 18